MVRRENGEEESWVGNKLKNIRTIAMKAYIGSFEICDNFQIFIDVHNIDV